MSFRLPPTNHPARELMGDMRTIATQLDPVNAGNLLPVWQARKQALAMMANDPRPGLIRFVCFVILRADSDERWLIRVGRKGGWRKIWNFGTGRD